MLTVTRAMGRRQLKIALAGHVGAEDVQCFARDYQAALRDAGWGSREFDLVIDATAANVQPQEAAIAFETLIRHAPTKARRIAIILSSQLAALQAKRLFAERDGAAIFFDRIGADRWLASATPDGRPD
jgi:hypothetical protein